MGRPVKDLHAFRRYLLEHRGLSPDTVTVYCSHIRRIVRQFDPNVPTTAEQVVAALVAAFPSARSRAAGRMAWRAFREWAATQGVEVPEPGTTLARDLAQRLPSEVVTALDYFRACGVPFDRLPNLRWVDVYPDRAPNRRVLPIQDTHFVLLSSMFDALRAWAQPPDEGAPLIPAAPGSTQPMPQAALRRAVAARTAQFRPPSSG
jgi:hypothetical protein